MEQGPPLVVPSQSPAPAAPVTDIIAWIMVAVALLAPFVDFALLRAFGIQPYNRLVSLAFMLGYILLGLVDANRIEASGRNVRGIHLRVWAVLFPPVYFIQRARALGQSFVMFFSFLGALAASAALSIFLFFGIWWLSGLPRCDTDFSAVLA